MVTIYISKRKEAEKEDEEEEDDDKVQEQKETEVKEEGVEEKILLKKLGIRNKIGNPKKSEIRNKNRFFHFSTFGNSKLRFTWKI